ncbi:MAG TPA: hypothetical protein VKX25_13595 [Bryobacteraceae bacterium]|jgi:hypothetical protein|nr:hypothetical protein [Bryobacteraceae bacterium]
MKSFRPALAVVSLTFGMLLGTVAPVAAAPYGFQYGDRFGDIRGLIDRTQNDLREAAQLEHNNGDARHRYDDAQKHLSTFDRHLTKGNFDKGTLDKAIDNLQAILDKNTLQASTRDALYRDVQDLRAARAHRY